MNQSRGSSTRSWAGSPDQPADAAASDPRRAGGGDPNQIYDQASQDLTRDGIRSRSRTPGFLRASPRPSSRTTRSTGWERVLRPVEVRQRGVEYARVESAYPKGDRVPAALYKLALSQEKLGRPPRRGRPSTPDQAVPNSGKRSSRVSGPARAAADPARRHPVIGGRRAPSSARARPTGAAGRR